MSNIDVWATPLTRIERRAFFDNWMTLSTDEHGRAQRYLRESDRIRFVYARGCLRNILSRYLGLQPEEICFVYGPNGKPRLDPGHRTRLTFNLSHDDALMVVAVADDVELGVDVEAVVDRDFLAVMRKSFTQNELESIQVLPDVQRKRAFYTGWTRKEAYLKANGGGFTVGPNEVEVTMLPWEPTALVTCPIPQHTLDWTLMDLPLGPNHAGALVAADRDVTLRFWRFDGGVYASGPHVIPSQ